MLSGRSTRIPFPTTALLAPTALVWASTWAARALAQAWFPPSKGWPLLQFVAAVPWQASGDFFSETTQLFSALALGAAGVLLVELLKIAFLRGGSWAPVLAATLFQAAFAFDTLACGAPDWCAHFLSLLAFRGTREVHLGGLPQWPWLSLIAYSLLVGSVLKPRKIAGRASLST